MSLQQAERSSLTVDSEGSAAVSNVVAGRAAQPDALPRRMQFCPDEPLSLEEAVPAEPETMINFAVVTPSPQYEQPPRSWMSATCSARSVPQVHGAVDQSAFTETCDTISLFRTLGLV